MHSTTTHYQKLEFGFDCFEIAFFITIKKIVVLGKVSVFGAVVIFIYNHFQIDLVKSAFSLILCTLVSFLPPLSLSVCLSLSRSPPSHLQFAFIYHAFQQIHLSYFTHLPPFFILIASYRKGRKALFVSDRMILHTEFIYYLLSVCPMTMTCKQHSKKINDRIPNVNEISVAPFSLCAPLLRMCLAQSVIRQNMCLSQIK